MKFKKIIFIFIIQFILVQAFSGCANITSTSYAKKKKTDTMSVVNVNATVSKKIHDILMKGKPVVIKVKGNSTTAKKKLTQTVNSVRKINKQGIIFKYKLSKKTGEYCYYTVSADNAKEYMYGVKYIKKLYRLTKEYMSTYEHNQMMLRYYQKYKNVDDIKLHIIYDHMCYSCSEGFDIDGDTSFITSDANTFVLYGKTNDDGAYQLTEEQWYSLVIKELVDRGEDENSIVRLNSFQEFKEKIKKYPNALKAVGAREGFIRVGKQKTFCWSDDVIPIEDKIPMAKILDSKYFGELSKANQIYLIDKSAYFCSTNKIAAELQNNKKGYGIQYSYDYLSNKKIKANADFKTPGEGMKKLYKCYNLMGVCSVYASYERLLFSQLGMKVWKCMDDKIGHDWTVVKVKNSVGKTLWVPFDYGIGPAKKLIISAKKYKKYLRTEAMRYKLYLSKVKGAPKKKNFVIGDFI